ncbi:hypothetical protein [Cohnella boryungensis]|uniref:Phage protein n=1 Tax=Cohnella boryungensis TaxID=768479 RepID=A0ABV8SGJ5_9BACL
MFENVNFEPGEIVYNDLQIDEHDSLEKHLENLKEDLFQVNYEDRFIIDVGWHPSFSKDGVFRVMVIEDFEWDSPIYQKTCRSMVELKICIEESVAAVQSRL